VIVAAGIGSLLLGERFGRLRILAATLVAVGILLLNLP
jgi:drug/metabolite transporter (DMT)-like permease